MLVSNCSTRSDCYGNRKITETIISDVNYNDSLLITKKDEKYAICNLSDTLINKQNYSVKLNVFEVYPNEKWNGRPSEILEINVVEVQKIDFLEINRINLYVGGGKLDNGKTITSGLYLIKKSDFEVSYDFTELINWQNQQTVKGIAKLQRSNNDQLETIGGEIESAYRFVDLENKIIIYLTKDINQNVAKSRIYLQDEARLSVLMYYK